MGTDTSGVPAAVRSSSEKSMTHLNDYSVPAVGILYTCCHL